MKSLYPEIECLHQSELLIDNHRIYYEVSGNPQGLPVIFLHGGPGSGCNPNHRRYFDPQKYRIVIFDQRGCNRSSPQGSIENNTTQHLLKDIEAIREKLGIDQWLVFGGSWGATLALLYSEYFPQRVKGLILRGSFLARKTDLDWFVKEGANRIFPEDWEKFIGDLSAEERQDIAAFYYRHLRHENIQIRQEFTRRWSNWATRIVTWNLLESKPDETDIDTLVNQVSIETHYAYHRYFISENQILNDIQKIPDVPVTVIHGRRDLTCTLEASWSLHKVLPGSELIIVPDAGHLASEPAMVNALVTATDRFAQILK